MSENIGTALAHVSRLIRKSFDEGVREIGVTRPQWQVLTVLRRNPGILQRGLAELLEVEPITAGRMIDRLQQSGLVERRADPADRRAWRIHLTGEGEALLDRLVPYARSTMEIALDGLNESDRVALLAALEAMRLNLTSRQAVEEDVHG
jgi:DNA-binding MarR family transcriptional regulator